MEDVFETISLVISGISFLPYILFLVYLLLNREYTKDLYRFIINIILLFSCIIQSSYYLLHKIVGKEYLEIEGSSYCKLFGSINVYADYSKMSISIIKMLYTFHAYFDIFSDSTLESNQKKLFVINFFASIVFPVVMGILTFLLGNVKLSNNNLCYHENHMYRVFVYIGFLIYYLIFFRLAWKIVLVFRRKSTPSTGSQASIILDNSQSHLRILLSYTSMIVLNCILYLGFVILFISGKENLMSEIFGLLLEPLSIPLFLIFFGINETDSLENFLITFACKKKGNISIETDDDDNNKIVEG